MSEKKFDKYNRWRSKTVCFRASEEEAELINRLVKLSGLTKREYIMRKLQNHEIKVYPNPRVFKALKNEIRTLVDELKKINDGFNEPNPELSAIVKTVVEMLKDLKNL